MGLICSFVEVAREKLVRVGLFAPQSWIGLKVTHSVCENSCFMLPKHCIVLQLLGLTCYQTSGQQYQQKGQKIELNTNYDTDYLSHIAGKDIQIRFGLHSLFYQKINFQLQVKIIPSCIGKIGRFHFYKRENPSFRDNFIFYVIA